jgi:hypothetical protein
VTKEERDMVNAARKLLSRLSSVVDNEELSSEISSMEEQLWGLLFPAPVDPEQVRAALLRGLVKRQ